MALYRPDEHISQVVRERRQNGRPSPAAGDVTAHGNWSPLGDCIGWIDGEDIYLEPTAAFRVVQTAGRDSGEVLPVSESTLKKRLRDKGLLASTDAKRQTLTIRRTIAGSSKDVLHFCRSTLLPEEPDEAYDYGQQPDGAGHASRFVGLPCREIPVSDDVPDNDSP